MAFYRVTRFLNFTNHQYLLTLFFISLDFSTNANAEFMVRDPQDNEIIFVGEIIQLECEAPLSVMMPTYELLDGEGSTVGHAAGFPAPENSRQMNFQLRIRDLTENVYQCSIMDNGNILMTERLEIEVRNEQPACYIDTGPIVNPGETVRLSCYRYIPLGGSTGAVWRQVDSTGTSQALNGLDSILINQGKRKTTASITVNADDSGSVFECDLTLNGGGSSTCNTLPLFVQQSNPLTVSVTLNSDAPLDKGTFVFATCNPSDPAASVTWPPNHESSEVMVTPSANVLIISIPEDTSLRSGAVLSFTCQAVLGGQTATGSIRISVVFPTTTTPTIQTTPMPTTVRIMTDNPGPIALGGGFTATCQSSQSPAAIIWDEQYPETDVTVSTDRNNITVFIPESSTLESGTILTFTCLDLLASPTAMKTLEVEFVLVPTTPTTPTSNNDFTNPSTNQSGVDEPGLPSSTNQSEVDEPEPTPSTDQSGVDEPGPPPDNTTSNERILYYVIGGILAVVLVGIIVIITVLICLTKQKPSKNKSLRRDDHVHGTTPNRAYVDHTSTEPSTDGLSYDSEFTHGTRRDEYSKVDRSNGLHVHPGSADGDGVPYSDVNRRRVSIHEEDIYNDTLGWNFHHSEI